MLSFNERVKRAVAENQDLFLTLEELDRTGKLRKRVYKQRANFTIDEDILSKFKKYCKKNSLSMSAVIENWIKDFLRNHVEKPI